MIKLRLTSVVVALEECQRTPQAMTEVIFRKVILKSMMVLLPENHSPLIFEELPLQNNVTYAEGERPHSLVCVNGAWHQVLQTLDEIEAQLKD